MSQENVEFVRRQIEAFNRGDFKGATEVLHEDVEWQVPHIATLDAPASGLLRGRREVIENFGQWLEAWESFGFEVTELRPGTGNNVFLAGIQTGRGRASGLDVTVPTFHVLTVCEGKIVRMRTFEERAEALEAVGLSE